MYEQTYYKADIEIWNAISVVVTPEQGWQIFLACLNNDFTTKIGDPVVDAFIEFLSLIQERDTED